ncbi:MAG: hypothetical protein WAL71_03975 [Terriglobales bacterium]
MRRLPTFAAFLLILLVPVCILTVPVCAQRGGHGGGGSGGHGGFSGGGHVSASGHSFGGGGISGSHLGSSMGPRSASRGYVGSGVAGSRSFYGRSGYGRPGYGRSGGTRFTIRTRPGYRYGYPYYGYYGYYDPYWWSDSGSSSDQDDAGQRQLANQMNQDNLDEQQTLQDQDAYAQPMRGPRGQSAREEARNEPQTVLVFRDQHQREIQNYAIADGLIWNFTTARTEKIPLAVIDIPATIKANDDRGVDFRLPSDGEGQ